VWRRMKSPEDSRYGRYIIGVHAKCPPRPA
jgi:hypothetical protein